MPTKKKRKKRGKRLLLRGKLARKAKAKRTAKQVTEPVPKQVTERINLTKRSVAALSHPPAGQRAVYRDSRTPHLCLRVTPTAKTFYWEKTILGRQKRVTIGRFPAINVEQARAVAADIAADYVKGTDVQQNRRARREEATFGDLWKDYRENRPRRTPEQKRRGEYSETLDQQWDRVLKKWENRKLSDVTYDIVSRLIRKMRNNGAPIYANRIQAHGRAMFNYAKRSRDWRWTGENPFDFDFVSEKGRARKERLRRKDMPAFFKGLDACSESMNLLFRSVLYTGRRRREVQGMKWGDIDLEHGIWTLRKTKAGEPQEAMLPTELIEMLVERKAKIPSGKDDPVFPSPSKSGNIEEVKKAWATVRKVSGLHKLQARDLRRTLASWAQDEKVPIAVMSSQLGHVNISTTHKHYTNIDSTVQRIALDATIKSMIEAAK